MKVGDLVIYKGGLAIAPRGLRSRDAVGIITGFDEDNDPKILNSKTGIVNAEYRGRVEVVSESR